MSKPMLSFNQIESNVLAITAGKKNIENWIYNNFIHLMISKECHWGCFLFDNDTWEDCPWITRRRLERDYIDEKYKSIIEFVIECINRNRYVYLFVVKNYIKCYETEKENVSIHDVFVYGYDEERKILYIADFFKNGKYQLEECSFQEFIDAYQAFKKGYRDGLNGVCTIEVVEKEIEYNLSPQMIKLSLQDYLKGIYPHSRYRFYYKNLWDYEFGIDIYTTLIKHCERIKNGLEEKMDFRMFELIYEQKKLMVDRILYLKENKCLKEHDDIVNEFKEISIALLKSRNRYIKYMLVKRDELLVKVIEELKLIYEKDRQCTHVLMDLIIE